MCLSMQRAFVDGRYLVERLLGSGGMAQVYLTHDEVLDRHVALKILRDQYAEDEEFIQRFRREARSAASLSHPNIVSIYDQGRSEDGAYYIAFEYVPGGYAQRAHPAGRGSRISGGGQGSLTDHQRPL